MYKLLKELSERANKNAMEFTQDLVRTPSPSFQEGHAANLVEERMKSLEYDKVFQDEAGNAVGILFGRENDSTVLLLSHLDTVNPVTELWDVPPFGGTIENGRIYGVGSSDCKGGLAAQIYAGDLLKRSLLPLKGNLVVAATTGESNGRSVGVKTLLDETLPEQGLKPTYAILGEPTDCGIFYGHDGWVEIEVLAEGSNPFQVDDTARAIFEDLQSDRVLHLSSDPSKSLQVERPRFKDLQGSRQATIGLNRRFSPDEKVDEILGQIRHNVTLVAQSVGDVAVRVSLRQETQKLGNGKTTTLSHIVHAWTTDPFCRLIDRSRQALSAAGCGVHPGKWKLESRGMGTAGGVLVQNYNIPTLGYGPGSEHLSHSPNEYVEIQKLQETLFGTAVIVQDLIGFPVFGWTSDDI